MGLLWSLGAIAVAFVLGEIGRISLRRILPNKQYQYAKELISSFELSAIVFEIVVIGKFYSFWVGILCSFLLLTFKNMVLILDGALASPCALFEDIYNKPKKVTVLGIISKVLLQVAGAVMAYPFVRKLWQFSASPLHSRQLEGGISPTLEISVAAGFAIEALATFLTTMSDFLSRGRFLRYNPIIRSSFCVLLCNTLTRTTGLWMNPALATAQTFFAIDHYGSAELSEHLIVYWLGPIVGTVVAIEINNRSLNKKDPKVCQRKNIAKKIRKSSRASERKQNNGVVLGLKGVVRPDTDLKKRTVHDHANASRDPKRA